MIALRLPASPGLPAGAALVALLLSGCTERASIRVREADSLGVRVVASGVRTRVLPAAFRLASVPRLAITPEGRDASAAPIVTAGALLPSGDVALVTSEGDLTRYGPSGEPRWVREGGAFALARGPGDSVTVLSAGDTVVVVASDGGARSVPLAWSGPEPLSEAWSAGDGFVVLTGWSTGMLPGDAAPGVRTDPAHLLRFSGAGRLLDTLATFPGTEVGLFALAGRVSIAPPHLPRMTVAASDGERIALGTGEADEIVILDPDGSVRMVVRREGRERHLTASDSAQARLFRRRILGDNPAADQILAELERVLPLPDARPPYAQLAIDPAGRMWVGDYPPPGELPSTFSVYAPGGALLGQVGLPPGFRLLDAGDGALLGVVPGPGGVVRVHDLLPADS